uniref:Uncharacterized protein n=1 Tax=Setaria viridis TaxID=4556 RepID=A0A4U6TAM1_SETVI|nr:hypothetical protein SEVIR_8G013525v2 [Setaria viridis]
MIISARMRMLDMIAEGSIKMITARSIVSDAQSIGDPGSLGPTPAANLHSNRDGAMEWGAGEQAACEGG